MIKVKKIGLVIEREVTIKSVLKDGTEIAVACEFISAENDRLYLRYPNDKIDLAQYFYEGKTIDVLLKTLDGALSYPSIILYEPDDKLIVVEYYPTDNDYTQQKRKVFRVKTNKHIQIEYNGKTCQACTMDISAGGFKFVTSENLELEGIYRTTFVINPNEKSTTLEFQVKKTEYIPNDEQYMVSAEFINLDELSTKKLVKFCFNSQISMLNTEK